MRREIISSNTKAERRGRRERQDRHDETQTRGRKGVFFGYKDTICAAAACLCTLFAELGEEAEAGDGRPGEDDGVPARDVLAELLGHEAV